MSEEQNHLIDASQIAPLVALRRPRKVYAGMWGIPEMIVVGIGLFAVLIFALLVAFLVLPAQRELENSKARRTELENELTKERARYGTMNSTQERVEELERSVSDFETRFLRTENEAKVSLYQRINGLIGALNLTNTTGPDYVPLEIKDANRTQNAEDKSGRSKLVSVFPGVFVTVTIDGSYQNIRRFIREIETGNEFVVISAVELEPSENKEKQPDPTKPPELSNQAVSTKVDRGKSYGETVTLRLELAGYYRRADFSPMPEPANAAQ
jgi:Tfp pilus assembly protein PilO